MDTSINASSLNLNSPYGFIRDPQLRAQMGLKEPDRLLNIAKPQGNSVASYVNSQSLYRGAASDSMNSGYSLATTAMDSLRDIRSIMDEMQTLSAEAAKSATTDARRIELNDLYTTQKTDLMDILETTEFQGESVFQQDHSNVFHFKLGSESLVLSFQELSGQTLGLNTPGQNSLETLDASSKLNMSLQTKAIPRVEEQQIRAQAFYDELDNNLASLPKVTSQAEFNALAAVTRESATQLVDMLSAQIIENREQALAAQGNLHGKRIDSIFNSYQDDEKNQPIITPEIPTAPPPSNIYNIDETATTDPFSFAQPTPPPPNTFAPLIKAPTYAIPEISSLRSEPEFVPPPEPQQPERSAPEPDAE